MICPVCNNQNVESYKMRESVMKNARVSCVGYHCWNCGHIGSALVDTTSDKGINKSFFEAEIRFKTI